MLKTLIGPVALAATLAALPAAAEETRYVRHDDLNLATSTGQERLQRRIDDAARDVCIGGDPARMFGLAQSAQVRTCLEQARARAARQMAALAADKARGG